jgi:hypothetical protein
MLKPFVLVVLLDALICGCYRGPIRPLMVVDRNVRFDRTTGDALVVFALRPNMVLTLVEGTDDGVSWHCAHSSELPVRVRPQDGFVVAWLPPRTGKQRYAIASLSTDASGLTRWWTKGQVLAFDAVPGQVTYLGALSVEFEGGELSGIVGDPDITDLQAEAFMASKFANVSAPLVKRRMDWLYLDRPCW